jgi:Domain of unknown function (DUF4864)
MDEFPRSNPPAPEESTRQNNSAVVSQISRAYIPNLLPRRLVLLFASSFVAFSLTTWFLARSNSAPDEPQADAAPVTPEGIVHEQLDALGQAKTRVAYALFSPRYRSEIPFEAFDTMVREHSAMFRANSVRKESEIATSGRDDITMHLETASGDRFIARYKLVLIEGRWWIDEMRWHEEAPSPNRTLAQSHSA